MTQPRSFPGRGHVYDVLVVGAGISGCEAAFACAEASLDVLLVTTSLDTVYNLAGAGAKLTPSPRTLMHTLCQEVADETDFVRPWELHRAAKYALEHRPGIHLLQSSVSTLIVEKDGVEDGEVKGVTTWEGVPRFAKRTALCVGSFLEARLTVGSLTEKAGRLSEMAYDDLYKDLQSLEFSFEDVEIDAPSSGGSLAYSVACKVFAQGERSGFQLTSFKNLYAAGLCAKGYLSYEDAALQGRNLADALIASL